MTTAQSPENSKGTAKSMAVKAETSGQGKVMNELRQEILTLRKIVEDMREKNDTQEIVVTISRKRLRDIHGYLIRFERETGNTMTMSEFISDAVDAFLWADEEDRKSDETRRDTK